MLTLVRRGKGYAFLLFRIPISITVLFLLIAVPGWAADKLTSDNAPVEMTLADAVFVALRNNLSIRSAYMDRITQKFDLLVNESIFDPLVNLEGGVYRNTNLSKTFDPTGTTSSRDVVNNGTLQPTLTEKVPTGADFTFSWLGAPKYVETASSGIADRSLGSSWNMAVVQPLLKGAWIPVNMISIKKARISEQQNIWNLKSTLISTITQTITAYRSFVQATRQVEISRASLERSKAMLEVNKLLIETGRMAAIDIVQTEAEVANSEFSHQSSINNADSARLQLLTLLNIDSSTRIIPTEKIETIEPSRPDFKVCLNAAFANRTDYLSAKVNIEASRLDLLRARNNYLPELSANFSYGYADQFRRFSSDSLSEQWIAGLTLKVPLYGDLTREQYLVSSKVALRKQELEVERVRLSIEIAVTDAVRNVESTLRQVQLAEQARKLSEKKLDIEQEKLKLGRTSNFQIVTYNNDLVTAQNNELTSKINYLNALATLDQTLGTTLDTWKIEFRSEDAEIEKRVAETK